MSGAQVVDHGGLEDGIGVQICQTPQILQCLQKFPSLEPHLVPITATFLLLRLSTPASKSVSSSDNCSTYSRLFPTSSTSSPLPPPPPVYLQYRVAISSPIAYYRRIPNPADYRVAMGRWKELDTDADRLPENMTRIGYDADTQVYTYRDNTDGTLWEGAPGATYGKLFPVKPPTPLPSVEVPEVNNGTEPGYVLEEGPDHDPFGDHNAVRRDDEKPKRGYSTRKRVDSVMDRIASIREKPDRRPSRRESRREKADAGYGDEKDLGRRNTTKKERDGHHYSEKETLPRSNTTRTSRAASTPSWDPRPSPPQEQDGSSKLKRAGTLSRISRFLTGKRKDADPDYDVTPGTGGASNGGNANGSRVHRWATGRRQRATTFDDILAGIPGQH
nr:hypothetical protein [Neurospora crassa]